MLPLRITVNPPTADVKNQEPGIKRQGSDLAGVAGVAGRWSIAWAQSSGPIKLTPARQLSLPNALSGGHTRHKELSVNTPCEWRAATKKTLKKNPTLTVFFLVRNKGRYQGWAGRIWKVITPDSHQLLTGWRSGGGPDKNDKRKTRLGNYFPSTCKVTGLLSVSGFSSCGDKQVWIKDKVSGKQTGGGGETLPGLLLDAELHEKFSLD